MKLHKIILLTAVAALTAHIVEPHGCELVSLTQQIAPSQPAQPLQPDHDHQPTGGEGPTTLAVGSQASGAFVNSTATTMTASNRL
jgi:hypothetical protein